MSRSLSIDEITEKFAREDGSVAEALERWARGRLGRGPSTRGDEDLLDQLALHLGLIETTPIEDEEEAFDGPEVA